MSGCCCSRMSKPVPICIITTLAEIGKKNTDKSTVHGCVKQAFVQYMVEALYTVATNYEWNDSEFADMADIKFV